MASHNVHQVRRIAERVGIMLDGELIEGNTKDRLFISPEDPRTRAFISGEFIF
ncbi:MAG TPA: hypothetical protein HA257_01865 [Candidatus Methanoperedenaceae archaeon]|nr:hypothetical protein [Candidatus Methanoperedenaceae archaeon]